MLGRTHERQRAKPGWLRGMVNKIMGLWLIESTRIYHFTLVSVRVCVCMGLFNRQTGIGGFAHAFLLCTRMSNEQKTPKYSCRHKLTRTHAHNNINVTNEQKAIAKSLECTFTNAPYYHSKYQRQRCAIQYQVWQQLHEMSGEERGTNQHTP